MRVRTGEIQRYWVKWLCSEILIKPRGWDGLYFTQHESNRIVVYSAEKTVIAEVDFPSNADGTVDVNHTFVDHSLRGKGIAGQLMAELVQELRDRSSKAALSCSYAIGWFEMHPVCHDVLNECVL